MEILPAGPLAGSPGIELLEATVAPLGAAAATEGPPLTTPSDSGAGEGVGEGEGAYISSFGTVSGGAIRGANCGGPAKTTRFFIKWVHFCNHDESVY